MNFARHQAEAERAGRRLAWLHGLATVAVVVAIDAIATLLWHALFGASSEPPRGFHATNVAVVLAFVVGGAWLETARLRDDYPGIRLRVLEGYSGQVEEWLTSQRVDIAIYNRYRRGRIASGSQWRQL